MKTASHFRARWGHLDDAHYQAKILASSVTAIPSGCWNWTRSLTQSGYGVIKYHNRQWRAHRLSYLLFVGELKDGALVMHKCDNRRCVNPSHLSLGSVLDNAMDMVAKGRSFKKLSDEQVIEIRKDCRSAQVIAEIFGVTKTHVLHIKQEKRRQSV